MSTSLLDELVLETDADPIGFIGAFWPHLDLYDKEIQIIRSFWENDRTVVTAAHQLGKDFTAGLIALVAFLTRDPCRIVTTSVDSGQLEKVLWGEIGKLIQECKYPLSAERGGPLLVNHLHIRKVYTRGPLQGEIVPKSYLIGRVAARGEGMSGHHLPRRTHYASGLPIPAHRRRFDDWCTGLLGDECSGVDQETIAKGSEWSHRDLLIGNPYECDNEFKWSVEGNPRDAKYPVGDVPRGDGLGGYERKVFEMSWRDSPNVQLAQEEMSLGVQPSGHIVIPGVLSWHDLKKHERNWDPVKKHVGLEGKFYKGADTLLYPLEWLNRAEKYAQWLRDFGIQSKPTGIGSIRRKARAIGVDPAEGGDKTCWAVVDEWGVIDLVSLRTPDTTEVTARTIALLKDYQVQAGNVVFDRGGGGKEHADRLRAQGYPVRTVAFGESVSPEPKRGVTRIEEKKEQREEHYAYKNRRAQMYGDLRQLLSPHASPSDEAWQGMLRLGNRGAKDTGADLCWGLPSGSGPLNELRRQLSLMPLRYDPEGRLYLPPKSKRTADSKEVSLTDLIGHSPDEADALVLAVHGMLRKATRTLAGAI